MKRWSNRGETENLKIDAFLEEIWMVCERHGLGLSHEDTHGSFEIVPLGEADRDWLMHANDRTESKS